MTALWITPSTLEGVDADRLRSYVEEGLCSPSGWPSSGLAPRTFELNWSPRSSSARLRERLERWERAQGNRHFEAVRLERVLSPFAFEMVAIYVALREQYPAVQPDRVDFFAQNLPVVTDAAGYAWAYAFLFPHAHAAALLHDVPTLDAISRVADDDLWDEVERERRDGISSCYWYSKTNDLRATGSLQFHPCLSIPREARKQQYREHLRVRRLASSGILPQHMPYRTSFAGALITHEFGHLLDATVLAAGLGVADYVYGQLSAGLYDIPRPELHDWRSHLLNFKGGYSDILAGPVQGGVIRQAIIKERLCAVTNPMLGTYAGGNRDELFAQSFAASHTAKSMAVRQALAPFRRALRTRDFSAAFNPDRAL